MPEPREDWAELGLWGAVLTSAADDAGSRDAKIAAAAWRWILSTSASPGSFRWVASLFDLDEERVLAAIRARGRRR